MCFSVKMKLRTETLILEINRNIMTIIISWSVKSGKVVYFKEPLSSPLYLVPVSTPFPMEVNDQQLKANF